MHGERLARINRWEFDLEEALAGKLPGQPIFVALANTHTKDPWDREALAIIAGAARRAVVSDKHEAATPTLVAALLQALTGKPSTPELVHLGTRLLAAVARSRAGNESTERADSDRSEEMSVALRHADLSMLPRSWRRCLTFLAGAGDQIERRDPGARTPISRPS